MRPILHHTTKYDGGLHYRFQAQVVLELENTLVLYRGPGVEIVSYRGSMTANRHLMVIFYGDRYHNVVISWHDDWTPHMHYVNIATPAKWDADTVTAVDMDLDILRLTEDGKVIIDDEDEFEHHRELFQYPQALVDTCRGELTRIHRVMEQREGVLSDAIFDWRPGDVLDAALVKAL
jgi:uncharacterized protein